MSDTIPLEVAPSAFAGLIGVGRRDTTPPLGIYARMWGAATHDRAEGVHRPLCVTALALQAGPDEPVRLLVGIDLALIGDPAEPQDAERILGPVREALGLTDGRLLVNCSHTHTAPWPATSRSHLPGGELIGPYLDDLGQALLEAGEEAVAGLVPATLTWATGRCDLARNRDLPDPAAAEPRIGVRLQPDRAGRRHGGRRARHGATTTGACSRRSSTTPAIPRRSRGTTRSSRRTTSAPCASWSSCTPAARRACSCTAPRASSGRRTSTSAIPRSPTGTGAGSASPPSRRSRGCCLPATRCGTRA